MGIGLDWRPARLVCASGRRGCSLSACIKITSTFDEFIKGCGIIEHHHDVEVLRTDERTKISFDNADCNRRRPTAWKFFNGNTIASHPTEDNPRLKTFQDRNANGRFQFFLRYWRARSLHALKRLSSLCDVIKHWALGFTPNHADDCDQTEKNPHRSFDIPCHIFIHIDTSPHELRVQCIRTSTMKV